MSKLPDISEELKSKIAEYCEANGVVKYSIVKVHDEIMIAAPIEHQLAISNLIVDYYETEKTPVRATEGS